MEGKDTSVDLEASSEPLVWDLARRVTSNLESAREFVGDAMASGAKRAGRLLGSLRDGTEDLAGYFSPAPWLEDVYASMGIASTGALADFDQRFDDIETMIETLARERARQELILLQARVGELEQAMRALSQHEARGAVYELADKLGSLEARIDAIDWPVSGSSSRG